MALPVIWHKACSIDAKGNFPRWFVVFVGVEIRCRIREAFIFAEHIEEVLTAALPELPNRTTRAEAA